MTQPSELPDYSPDKFVDRRDEIESVKSKACAFVGHLPIEKRTIIFTGERGTGKTWLLAHLRNQLSELGVSVLLLDLGAYADWNPSLAVAEILGWLSGKIGMRREGLGVTLAEMSRNLMQNLQQFLDRQPLVLLVDQVHESDWRLLAVLEDYLLGPLAVEPRVLIAMAGRGRLYPWKTPELRLKAEFIELQPFPDESITAEQLKRQHKKAVPRASEIHKLSGGNPLANYLLAVSDDPAAGLNWVVGKMVETVPADRRRRVRDYLEALCVLRSFDEARIPMMLATYYGDDNYRNWSYAQARQVREELVKWAFARWDADWGGYVLDEPTRKLVERYLETTQHDRWESLHQAASALYEGWVKQYPSTGKRWQEEVDYHTGRLRTPRSNK